MVTVRNERGFTMLELLIVVLIVGILVTLAVPQYVEFTERARVVEATSMIAAIRRAVQLRKSETGSYASTDEQLQAYVSYPTSGTTTYWTYHILGSSGVGYIISATRTTKGTTTNNGKYINYVFTTSANGWTGNYPYLPSS